MAVHHIGLGWQPFTSTSAEVPVGVEEQSHDREAARRRAAVRTVIAWVGPMLALALFVLLYMLW